MVGRFVCRARPSKLTLVSALLATVLSVRAQELPELLQAVDDAKARRLIAYNSPWLEAELYFAKRFRIVEVDESILLRDDDFTIMPFDDTGPLRVTKESVLRYEEAFSWAGTIVAGLPEQYRAVGARQRINLYGLAWDTDDSGEASESSENRSQSSPQRILTKFAFYSVAANFELLLPRVRYRLTPLKYTPKYAVILEVDPEKLVPTIVDRSPEGEVVTRSPAEQQKSADYEAFLRGLSVGRDVPIVEDLP